jgi:outer membrane protein OmpA-like peptidoglycan-associated protein
MKRAFPVAVMVALLFISSTGSVFATSPKKDHDFISRFQNLIFLVDVSDSMLSGYPQAFDHARLFVATRALRLFNAMMPPVPLWQYDLNTALVTFGDCGTPRLVGMLSPWFRKKHDPEYPILRLNGWGPWRTAGFQEGLQVAGQLVAGANGRTAILVLTDGGSIGECPQAVAAAMKDKFGDKVQIYGIFFGDMEGGWRNLYEVCKLTGGYARTWEEVRTCKQMKDFSWDILVREIMFPYPEIFFKHKSADLLLSEALKLESVANFLHAIPQYMLQIDGHNDFFGDTKPNYELAMARAKNVKQALVQTFSVHPERIAIRSFGEELPLYDNQNPEMRQLNRQANLYLRLPLRNCPYNEKKLHTFDVKAVGDIFNTQERYSDNEWAWPDTPPPGSSGFPKPRTR